MLLVLRALSRSKAFTLANCNGMRHIEDGTRRNTVHRLVDRSILGRLYQRIPALSGALDAWTTRSKKQALPRIIVRTWARSGARHAPLPRFLLVRCGERMLERKLAPGHPTNFSATTMFADGAQLHPTAATSISWKSQSEAPQEQLDEILLRISGEVQVGARSILEGSGPGRLAVGLHLLPASCA